MWCFSLLCHFKCLKTSPTTRPLLSTVKSGTAIWTTGTGASGMTCASFNVNLISFGVSEIQHVKNTASHCFAPRQMRSGAVNRTIYEESMLKFEPQMVAHAAMCYFATAMWRKWKWNHEVIMKSFLKSFAFELWNSSAQRYMYYHNWPARHVERAAREFRERLVLHLVPGLLEILLVPWMKLAQLSFSVMHFGSSPKWPIAARKCYAAAYAFLMLQYGWQVLAPSLQFSIHYP